jgi:hypothetical protein
MNDPYSRTPRRRTPVGGREPYSPETMEGLRAIAGLDPEELADAARQQGIEPYPNGQPDRETPRIIPKPHMRSKEYREERAAAAKERRREWLKKLEDYRNPPNPQPPSNCPPPWISPRPPECDEDYEPPDPGPDPDPGPGPDPDPGPGPDPDPDPDPNPNPPPGPAPDYGPFGAGSPYAGQDPFSNPANLPYYWTPDLGYSHLYAPPWGSGYGVPTQQEYGGYAPGTYGNYYLDQGNWGDPYQPPQSRAADPSAAMTPYPANTYGSTYYGTGYSSYGYPSYGYGYPSYGYGYY